MFNKKIINYGLAVALMAPVALGLAGCGKGPSKSSVSVKSKDVYAMSAVTSASFLSSAPQSKIASYKIGTGENADQLTRPSGIEDSHVEKLDTYIGMFGSMIESGFEQTSAPVEATDEKHKDFKVKLTVKLPATNEIYTMYYNEVDSKTNEEIKEDGKESEVSTKLEGVLEYGEEVFNLLGERTFEQEVEGEETETEAKIVFKTSKQNPENPTVFDNQNYMEVEQGFEVELENGKEEKEVTYKYTLVKNGVKLSTTELEFENEDNKEELELKFKNSKNDKIKYSVKQDGTKTNEYIVTLKNGTAKETFKILVDIDVNHNDKFVYPNYEELVKNGVIIKTENA